MDYTKSGKRSAANWDEVMRNRKGTGERIPARRSNANRDEIMRDPAVTAVTTMTLPNSAEPHDEKTDEELLEHMRRRAPWLKHILSLSRARINAEHGQ